MDFSSVNYFAEPLEFFPIKLLFKVQNFAEFVDFAGSLQTLPETFQINSANSKICQLILINFYQCEKLEKHITQKNITEIAAKNLSNFNSFWPAILLESIQLH